MPQKTSPLLPATEALLHQFSQRLRLARLRRKLTAKQVAERAGMAAMTLRSLERGGAGVTIGAYLSVMQVLGIEADLNLVGELDPVGRQLQDSRMVSAVAKPRQASKQRRVAPAPDPPASSATPRVVPNAPIRVPNKRVRPSRFVSATDLVGLLEPVPSPRKAKR
jgi:transcriptional regulator with XRE-family HTH domain